MDLMLRNGTGGCPDWLRYGGGCFSSDGPCVQISLGFSKGPALVQSYLEVDAAAYAREIWARDIPLN